MKTVRPTKAIIKRLFKIDKFKAIELMNEHYTLERRMKFFAGTSLFTSALDSLHKCQIINSPIYQLCYLYSPHNHLNAILKFKEDDWDMDWLNFHYWIRRDRIDKVSRKELELHPRGHNLYFSSLLRLRLFKEARGFYAAHGTRLHLYGFWLEQLLLYLPGAEDEIRHVQWLMQRSGYELNHHSITQLYSAWLRIHNIHVRQERWLEYPDIVNLLSKPPTDAKIKHPKQFKFLFHQRFKIPIKHVEIKKEDFWMQNHPDKEQVQETKVALDFYKWIKHIVKDEKRIRDCMMTIHVQHAHHLLHQQLAEVLYSYWNDPALDPLIWLLFQKSGQYVKAALMNCDPKSLTAPFNI